MKTNKFWIVILGGVVIISAIAALLLGQTPASSARIYQNGFLINTIDLNELAEPYSRIIEANGGGFNMIEAEHGRIRVSMADCPDGSCVRQGWISGGVMPIVCLPHRLVIILDSGNEHDVDAIVG